MVMHVVLPEMSPVVFAGTAAVPVSLPTVAGAVPSSVTVLTGTGNELPTELLEYVRFTENCLSVDVDVALPEVSPAVFAGAAAVLVS